MIHSESKQPNKKNKMVSTDSDLSSSDINTDKTGTDKNSDLTQIIKPEKNSNTNKFDKPKRETNPDKTSIDIESDKTKKEK